MSGCDKSNCNANVNGECQAECGPLDGRRPDNCNPADLKFGVPSHPASATCKQCTARTCCVIWDCPLRNEIYSMAKAEGIKEGNERELLDLQTLYNTCECIPLKDDCGEFDKGFHQAMTLARLWIKQKMKALDEAQK